MRISRTTVAATSALAVLGLALGTGAAAATGNGAPSGPHYNLNIIGTSDKNPPMDNQNGHRIFVPLDGKTKINLYEGDFAVLDANGTDADGAAFQLPNPDPENDGVSEYSVYARALGKPGGSAKMTTCATDPATGEELCSVETLSLERIAGTSRFVNATKQLLYIYVDLDGDGTAERYNLFSDALEDYFWEYDNKGLRIAQLRFYPVSTDVN